MNALIGATIGLCFILGLIGLIALILWMEETFGEGVGIFVFLIVFCTIVGAVLGYLTEW